MSRGIARDPATDRRRGRRDRAHVPRLSAGMHLGLAHFRAAHWCELLAHRCDGIAGTCSCTCHA